MNSTSFSKTIRSSLEKYSSLIWILANTLGFFVVNLNFIGLLFQNWHMSSYFMLIYLLVLSPIFSGLIFGLIQFGYLNLFNRAMLVPYWAIRTTLSFLLVNLLNSYLPGFLLFPFFRKLIERSLSYSSNSFTGIVIGHGSNVLEMVLIATAMGILIGLWSGFILGFFPALSFSDRKFAREWILRVTISGCISFIVNSIYYTITYNQNPTNINLGELYRVGFVITGLTYGLMTKNTVNKLLHNNEKG